MGPGDDILWRKPCRVKIAPPHRAVSHFSEVQMRVRDGSADVAGAVYGHHACLRDLDRKRFQSCPPL